MTIAVIGALGKMGTEVIKFAKQKNYTTIPIDKDSNIDNVKCDIVIDFSCPCSLDNTIAICTNNNCPLVSGVTGYSTSQLEQLHMLSNTVSVVHKHNFSLGILAISDICQLLASTLPNWQYNIVEQHHTNKVDCPSGTAISLAADLQPIIPHTNSIRSGNTIGIHTIIANGEGESITITHQASSRKVFAIGALHCAEKLLSIKDN